MGSPAGFKELPLPAYLLHALHVLAFFRKLVSTLFPYIGLPDFLAHEISRPDPIQLSRRTTQFSAGPGASSSSSSTLAGSDDACSAAALLAAKIVPVVRYSDLLRPDPEDCCAVCLAEFGSDDEVRRLTRCRHVFHRGCLDRWMVLYQKLTCPVCRNRFVPDEFTEYFKQTVWVSGSGVYGLYGEISTAGRSYYGFNFL